MSTINYISCVPDQWETYQQATFAEDYEIAPTMAYADGIKSHDHKYCPAHKEWCKNRWTFYMPFDLHLRAIPDEGKMLVSDTVNHERFNQLIEINEHWWDEELPEVQVRYNTLFWTDAKHVWIEYTGHPTLAQHGMTIVPGTFPISSWLRSLPIGLVLHKLNEDLYIKRGTPLFHARFYDKRGSKFKLRRKAPPLDKVEQIKQDQDLKNWMPFASWDLIMKRESKCPFRKFI